MSLSRRSFLLLAYAAPLAACGGVYQTAFPQQLSPAVTNTWRITSVRVVERQSLTVSEVHSLVPEADIVWREDPVTGDRHQQVAVIMHDAIAAGARALRGSHSVILQATVSRFHALTFEAETELPDAVVHNIQFDIQAVDARSGAVLSGPTHIEADLPALSGAQMAAARLNGQTQKSMIIAHVAQTIQAWLGVGPDNRGTFTRPGN